MPYIKIDGYCQRCPSGNECKYFISLQQKPDGELAFIDFTVKRVGEHNHDAPVSKQQPSSNRVKLSVNTMESLPSPDKVLRQLQLFAQQMPITPKSYTWLDMLENTADIFQGLLGDGQLQGYIEHIQNCPNFGMILFMREQLDCIQSVPKDRILHISAAASSVYFRKEKVSIIPTKKNRFIPNHFYLFFEDSMKSIRVR
jgi:hypothetical protein